MPRSAWLAIGATIAALLLVRPPDDATGPPTMAMAVVLIATATFLAGTCLSSRWRRMAIPLALGAAAIALRVVASPAAPPLGGAPDGRGPWTMVVESVGSPRDGHQTATLRSAATGASGFRLAATLPRYPSVGPGDRVTVGGRVRPRPDSPYGRYLERIGAWGNLDADTLRPIGAADGPAAALERLRRAAGDALAATLPEPEAGLAAGILIGLRDRVDRQVAADFTTAGVSHVVAISGWNIAIVAAAIAALAGRLGRRRRAVVTVIAIVAYVLFAGASPSVLRAGAMAGVVLLARETGRAGYAVAALGWAAALLLLADPGLVSDAGFQLSTVATAGLIAWATPVSERIERLGRGRLPGWLVESLGVSLAAQAATLPIVLASFGRLAVVAPVVNLLVVPLVAPAMAAGLLAMAGGAAITAGAPLAIGAILAAPAWVALRAIISIVSLTAALPMASLTLEPPLGAIAGTGTVAVALALVLMRRHLASRPRRHSPAASQPASQPARSRGRPSPGSRIARAATMALVASLAVTGGVIAVRPTGVARVTVLDVGQGDAILIEGASGGRLLVDGGPDPDRLLVVLDRHLPPWDRRIDAVILTHPHEDHVAGLALLLDRYRIGRVFEPGMRGPGPGYAAWLERLRRPDAPQRRGLATGDRLTVDDIGLRVLWPDPGQVPQEPADSGTGINNVSIVLLGEVGGRRFLLTGDIEQEIDPIVVARGLPRVDLLKIAHHGSRTASTEAFVAAAGPSIAIASAGADNPYGHPARSTVDRLRSAGARVYRTDVDGTVTIAFESGAMTVRTQPRPFAERARPATPAVAGTAERAASSPFTVAAGVPTRSFLCAVPASVPLATAAQAAPTATGDPRAAAGPTPDRDRPDRLEARLRYHRPDDGALAGGGRCPAALPGSSALGARARVRRGRGRGLARSPDRGTRHRRGPAGRGGRGPAPRRGQAAPRDGPGARPCPTARGPPRG